MGRYFPTRNLYPASLGLARSKTQQKVITYRKANVGKRGAKEMRRLSIASNSDRLGAPHNFGTGHQINT
jgi:hypothetical protein